MNISPSKNAAATRPIRSLGLRKGKGSRLLLRVLLLIVVGASLMMVASVAPHAQRTQERPVRLTGVTTRKTSDGRTVYTITADAPLNRAQTWQDGSGQHVVLYKGSAVVRGQLPPGVRVGQVSESLEIVLPANERQRIVVQPRLNQIDVVISGRAGATDSANEVSERAPERAGNEMTNRGRTHKATRQRSSLTPLVTEKPSAVTGKPIAKSLTQQVSNQPLGSQQPLDDRVVANPDSIEPAVVTAPVVNPTPVVVSTAVTENVDTGGSAMPGQEVDGGASFYHLGFIAGAMMCGVLALVFARRRRNTDEMKKVEEFFSGAGAPQEAGNGKAKSSSTATVTVTDKTKDKKITGNKSRNEDVKERRNEQALAKREGAPTSPALRVASPVSAAPVVMFGAYQVDQEVGKLVHGEAHRLDVLCSRATDDRRAIETSLMKALQGQHSSETVRRKSRQALEDYGFVARACAALLLTPEGHDRIAAARTLSAIASPTALGFLIEALYDREPAVRAEAVIGLGALRLPSAIGALLDVARRHSDISPALLSRALTACSVEAIDFGIGVGMTDGADFGINSNNEAWTGEIIKLEPVETVMALPEWLEDETLTDAFECLNSTDVEARAAAARQLAQFPVQRSVASLSHIAAKDSEPSVRAAAVTSLGVVDHESVFTHVLLRLVDEAREVRAAAARSLSRLSFDRADAYVRVTETEDAATLAGVATALTGAGMASQAIDRLTSEDRRQAYEAFSLLSLLVRAGEVEPLLSAIAVHSDTDVRLALIRFLGLTGGALYIEQLKEIASRANAPEAVRMAITEAAAKVAQSAVCEAK